MRNLSTKIMTKISYKHIVSLLFIMLIGYSSPLYAQVYVDSSATGAADGLTWTDAFTNIQDAIDAVPGVWNCGNGNRPVDQIWVAAGTYPPIDIYKEVSIYGGFAGGEMQLDQRNPEVNVTIIDGSNTTRCVEITAFCEINGFVIENGYASNGGGVYIDYTPEPCPQDGVFYSPYIIRCKIRHNIASNGSGGGIYASDCSPNILVCNFHQNEAVLSGGACFFLDSSPTIKRCKFRGNEAGASGGAIWGYRNNAELTNRWPEIVNCTFRGNVAHLFGGGIACREWHSYITNCTFRNNSASSGGAFHGNINQDSPYISNSIFWNDSPDEIDIQTTQNYTVSYCDIDGGYVAGATCIDCVGNINLVPNFVSPGDSRLTLGSPCIDSGYDVGYWVPDIDLNRYPRPLDGDGDYILEYDMGAFEFPDQS